MTTIYCDICKSKVPQLTFLSMKYSSEGVVEVCKNCLDSIQVIEFQMNEEFYKQRTEAVKQWIRDNKKTA